MQQFERGTEPPPTILRERAADASRKAFRDFMQYGRERLNQTNVPRFNLHLESDKGLEDSLRRLFRGRCAFCEATAPVMPYYFRPITEALPAVNREQAHLYYAWLETAWENFYPICDSCLPNDPHYFPVSGARCPIPSLEEIDRFVEEGLGLWRPYPLKERALLLDPCGTREPHRSLLPRIDGFLLPLSSRGELTIQHFNLNAEKRAHARQNRYGEYFSELTHGLSNIKGIDFPYRIFSFQELEFGGTWYMLLRRLALAIAKLGGFQQQASPSRIQQFYASIRGKKNSFRLLDSAWQQLIDEDSKPPQAQIRHAGYNRPNRASLSRITLSNFKAIEKLSITFPEASRDSIAIDSDRPVPSLLILGENAVGKSSILEATALALADQSARDRVNTAQRWVLSPHYLGCEGPADIGQATIEIQLSNKSSRNLIIETTGIQAFDSTEWSPIPVFAFGAFRQYKQAQRAKTPDQYIRNLFDGSDIANPEQWLLKLDNDRFDMAIRALREILSIEGDFDVVERDANENTCFVVTAVPGTGHRMKTPLRAVSSGFRSVLAMACDVMHGLMNPRFYPNFESLSTARGVVLIDEVEAHLHPRWKMQIMRGLRRALPQMTFIATTHDPLCLRGMNDGEVIVLQRVAGKEATTPTNFPVFVEQLINLPNVSQLRIDQLLTSNFFQLYSTDAPEMEEKLAKLSDLLSRNPDDLLPDELRAMNQFQQDLAEAMPIGGTEAHRIVQEAVAEYLKKRRQATADRVERLRDDAKTRIIQALQGI